MITVKEKSPIRGRDRKRDAVVVSGAEGDGGGGNGIMRLLITKK